MDDVDMADLIAQRHLEAEIRKIRGCPFCGAEVGEPCMSKRRMEMSGLHASRKYNDE